MSTIPDPQISQLDNIDLLMRLSKDNGFLSFLLKLDKTDQQSFGEMLGWSSSLRSNLAKSEHILRFLNSLRDDELSSLRSMMSWSPALLARFKEDPSHLSSLHKMWKVVPDHDTFVKSYFTVLDHPNSKWCNARDAFTKGQIDSKMWLIDTASSLKLQLGRTWILCGWIGTLGYLMLLRREELGITHIRSFDVNPFCYDLADTLNRKDVKDGWKFKASQADANDLSYDDFLFSTVKYDGTTQVVQDTADTVINTSCDHMGQSNAWFESIPKGKLVILQNNDWFDNEQHDNSVPNIGDFKKMYPMSDLLFEGTLECELYNRFMLIGRK